MHAHRGTMHEGWAQLAEVESKQYSLPPSIKSKVETTSGAATTLQVRAAVHKHAWLWLTGCVVSRLATRWRGLHACMHACACSPFICLWPRFAHTINAVLLEAHAFGWALHDRWPQPPPPFTHAQVYEHLTLVMFGISNLDTLVSTITPEDICGALTGLHIYLEDALARHNLYMADSVEGRAVIVAGGCVVGAWLWLGCG